jgi:hypothetical protein
MTIQVGDAATPGEKELKKDWPEEEGLTAGYKKQTGRVMNLIAQDSIVLSRNRKGINGG